MANGLTIGALTLTPTIDCIGAVAAYTGDDNANATAILEYRIDGMGDWIVGLPMAKIYLTKAWAGSVIGCLPGILYDVRITFTDADGVTGTNPIADTITTRPDEYALGTGGNRYVSHTGITMLMMAQG